MGPKNKRKRSIARRLRAENGHFVCEHVDPIIEEVPAQNLWKDIISTWRKPTYTGESVSRGNSKRSKRRHAQKEVELIKESRICPKISHFLNEDQLLESDDDDDDDDVMIIEPDDPHLLQETLELLKTLPSTSSSISLRCFFTERFFLKMFFFNDFRLLLRMSRTWNQEDVYSN